MLMSGWRNYWTLKIFYLSFECFGKEENWRLRYFSLDEDPKVLVCCQMGNMGLVAKSASFYSACDLRNS